MPDPLENGVSPPKMLIGRNEVPMQLEHCVRRYPIGAGSAIAPYIAMPVPASTLPERDCPTVPIPNRTCRP